MTAPLHANVLVLDFHPEDPHFAGPKWFPEGTDHARFRVARGELPESVRGWTHVVLSGSRLSILEDPDFLPATERLLRQATEHGVPMMGVCYGSQLIARALLGREHVRRCRAGIEAGWLATRIEGGGRGWFDGLPDPFHAWHSHLDEVCDLPAGWRVLASTPHCPVQAWENEELRLFGTQFHPEMDAAEGNACFLADRATLAEHGLDADLLVERTRDDGSRVLIERFLRRDWDRPR